MGEAPVREPFETHVELLQLFLAHRTEIIESIQGALNAQRKTTEFLQDRPRLSRQLEDCFFRVAALESDQSRLRGQLEAAHWASGFKPRQMPDLHNDIVAPAEMMMRALHYWRQTRWPGRNGRLRYAHTLFNLYVLRCLELLSMRLWDAGSNSAGDRLLQVQGVLDRLWSGTPADQPRLVHDAHWLIPLAQSPTTDELAAYFEVAEHVDESLAEADRLRIQRAHVVMIGGHLRSQIRHYALQDGVAFDEHSVVLRTRTSNALDFALLIQGLVSLLKAYEHACRGGDRRRRLELAGAILQGISPDPELFLNRIDLLGAYSMIEHVFVSPDPAGAAALTPLGRRHLRLFREYAALIGRLAKPLCDDGPQFRPVAGACSPYGVIYGTPANLTEMMALKTLQPDVLTHFSLEDVFVDGDARTDKIAWVNGWRQLPHIDPEVQKLYEYPGQFAADIFERIEDALRRRALDGETSDAERTGRLFLESGYAAPADSLTSLQELPVRYCVSSDAQVVAEGRAAPCDQTQLLRDRHEGHFVVSYRSSGGWVAISKDFLTEILGTGRDVKLAGLPRAAAAVAALMCPDIAASQDSLVQASVPPSMLKA